jgi:hypothetical protein
MLASSRGDFFDVVLNRPTPQGWSGEEFRSSAQFSNPANEMESKKDTDEFTASRKNTHAASKPSHAEPQTGATLKNANPRSSQPVASVDLVKEAKAHDPVTEGSSSEYKIESRSASRSNRDTKSKVINTGGKFGILVHLVCVY